LRATTPTSNAHPADDKRRSADAAVHEFLAAGVPARKLVLGVPFYGRAWGEVEPVDKGLYRPGKTTTEQIATGYGALSTQLVNQGGYERVWDAKASAPYLWNAEKRIFISYDDPQSLRAKCRYVRERGLAGVMFWEYYADRTGVLLETLFQELSAPP